MPILTEISVNRTRATLLFDDRTQLTVRKSDLAACPVQVGDEVDTDAYASRVCAHQFKDSFDAALSILDYSARTEREIEKKLLAKGFLPDCVSAVLERLRETRLIDDREIALRAAEFASAGKTGVYALKRKLRARGIRESDVEDALETISDEDQLAAAAAVAKKLAPRYEGRDPREAHAKLSQALARRGFSWSVIEQTLSMPDMDDTDFT